jgi:hypothetical protein
MKMILPTLKSEEYDPIEEDDEIDEGAPLRGPAEQSRRKNISRSTITYSWSFKVCQQLYYHERNAIGPSSIMSQTTDSANIFKIWYLLHGTSGGASKLLIGPNKDVHDLMEEIKSEENLNVGLSEIIIWKVRYYVAGLRVFSHY